MRIGTHQVRVGIGFQRQTMIVSCPRRSGGICHRRGARGDIADCRSLGRPESISGRCVGVLTVAVVPLALPSRTVQPRRRHRLTGASPTDRGWLDVPLLVATDELKATQNGK